MRKIIKKGLIEESKSIYHDYGYFVIEFEQLVLSITLNIYTLFSLDGIKNLDYLKIILQDQTAYPLNSKLRSLIATYYKDVPKKFQVVDPLFIYTP